MFAVAPVTPPVHPCAKHPGTPLLIPPSASAVLPGYPLYGEPQGSTCVECPWAPSLQKAPGPTSVYPCQLSCKSTLSAETPVTALAIPPQQPQQGMPWDPAHTHKDSGSQQLHQAQSTLVMTIHKTTQVEKKQFFLLQRNTQPSKVNRETCSMTEQDKYL